MSEILYEIEGLIGREAGLERFTLVQNIAEWSKQENDGAIFFNRLNVWWRFIVDGLCHKL